MSVALAPSKGADGEAFPVASLALAPAVRAPVLDFYRFVRTADDIADAPDLPSAEKLRRLAVLEAALASAEPAEPAAAALARADRIHGTGIAEARRLLEAFRQDAAGQRCAEWDDLLAYCRLSANPVGRFLLRLHGEREDAGRAADALCTALQILNHLQDLAEDRRRLDRVYLPQSWLAHAGGEAAFFAQGSVAARRPVLDAALDRVDLLVMEAASLPADLKSSRLAVQAAATLDCARLLAARLRRRDPVRERVGLGRIDLMRALGHGLAGRLLGRPTVSDAAICRAIVHRSGTSFRWGIASVAGDRRRAMHALYAFCRLVDDAADSAAPPAARLRFIDAWREELGRFGHAPHTPVGRELAWASARFRLPGGELELLLDGMAADAVDRVRLADTAALDRYCRAVAGTVGRLAIRIFGAPGADEFALRLARALQLVNVLRDLEEDAARDRVYVPTTWLGSANIPDGPAEAIIGHHRFASVWARVASEAEGAFAMADAALAGLDRRRLRPALLMRAAYRWKLGVLRQRGWQPGLPPPRLGPLARVQLAGLLLRSPS